jgi:aerobic carbon-monoxide dehydrogenase small subunit
MKRVVTISVNGDAYEVAVAGGQRLIDVIRDTIGLTGTKEGCGEGECGACTVIMDGRPVNSCLVLAAQADGAEIVTIEGLMEDGGMSLIQRNFVDLGAVQCGFCSPGMILTAKALLDENPDPTEQDVREALAGNLCRCTGYDKIVDAVLATADAMRAGAAPAAGAAPTAATVDGGAA